MSDEQVLNEWRFALEELAPAIQRVSGVRSVKFYSGAGALRADVTALSSYGWPKGGQRRALCADVSCFLAW